MHSPWILQLWHVISTLIPLNGSISTNSSDENREEFIVKVTLKHHDTIAGAERELFQINAAHGCRK